jgi:hypothetical protein
MFSLFYCLTSYKKKCKSLLWIPTWALVFCGFFTALYCTVQIRINFCSIRVFRICFEFLYFASFEFLYGSLDSLNSLPALNSSSELFTALNSFPEQFTGFKILLWTLYLLLIKSLNNLSALNSSTELFKFFEFLHWSLYLLWIPPLNSIWNLWNPSRTI